MHCNRTSRIKFIRCTMATERHRTNTIKSLIKTAYNGQGSHRQLCVLCKCLFIATQKRHFSPKSSENMQIYLALWSIMSNSKGERNYNIILLINNPQLARFMFMRPLCTAILIAIECDCYHE